MKYILISLSAAILTILSTNLSIANSKKPPYEIIINGDGFSEVKGKIYREVTVYLNNNTSKTLFYKGAGCPNLLFELNKNPYFHLSSDLCESQREVEINLPPHRSQKMKIYLTSDKMPNKNVTIGIKMRLHKRGKDNSIANGNTSFVELFDSTTLHYDKGQQPFWPKDQIKNNFRRQQRILLDKDIDLLSGKDLKNYTLIVYQNKISNPRDTVQNTLENIKREKVKVINVPIVLVNNSADTLKFYSMSCSWFEFWGTNKPEISIPAWACYKNNQVIITVSPHKKYNKTLTIIYNPTIGKKKYRISMSLIKAENSSKRDWDFWPNDYVRYNKVWSNEIMVQ